MQVKELSSFVSSKKSYRKDEKLLNQIDDTIDLFKNNHNDVTLHFKKITCKRDKQRHSIRVPGTQHRIMMTYYGDYAELICICKHDRYDRLIKNC